MCVTGSWSNTFSARKTLTLSFTWRPKRTSVSNFADELVSRFQVQKFNGLQLLRPSQSRRSSHRPSSSASTWMARRSCCRPPTRRSTSYGALCTSARTRCTAPAWSRWGGLMWGYDAKTDVCLWRHSAVFGVRRCLTRAVRWGRRTLTLPRKRPQSSWSDLTGTNTR